MAEHQSHISFSFFLAVLYALAGLVIFNIAPEHVLLGAVVVTIAGMLPDVDGGGQSAAHELGGMLAAVFPLLLIESFHTLRAGGVARIALVVICSYMLARIFVVRGLQQFTVHRGMIHSVPAAIITAQLTYLLFWDLPLLPKIFVSLAALFGFMSHLLMDAYTNINIVGRAMGKQQKQQPALKFFGNTLGTTLAMYGGVLVLGWFMAKDFYPRLHVAAHVLY